MTKKHNIIVVSVAAIISFCILITAFNKPSKRQKIFSCVVFEGVNGWGYDILVDDSLFIHQESIPMINGVKGFPKKEQAEQAAGVIINKMKRGQLPVITTFEINQLISTNNVKNE